MLFPPSASHPSSSSPIRFLHATHWRLCKMWAIIHRSFIPCPSFPTAKSLIGGGGGGGDSSAAGDGQLGQLKWTTSSADHPLCSVMVSSICLVFSPLSHLQLRSLRVHLTFLLLLTLPLPAAMNSCGLDYKWSCGASPSPYQLSLSEQMSCRCQPRALSASLSHCPTNFQRRSAGMSPDNQ